MKAVYRDYKHKGYLFIDDGKWRTVYNIGMGEFMVRGYCMAESHSQYKDLFKSSLPVWRGYREMPNELIRNLDGSFLSR